MEWPRRAGAAKWRGLRGSEDWVRSEAGAFKEPAMGAASCSEGEGSRVKNVGTGGEEEEGVAWMGLGLRFFLL